MPDHRFFTRADERQKMIDRRWIAEGFGVGVPLCVDVSPAHAAQEASIVA
ncbi:MAG TPA: hypothetical protein VGR63_10620 [Casimicrobiaceae bacterium]|nr:hypothetical protein [Casimicrobiaceae bacterium]